MYCLQQKKTAYVNIVGVEGKNVETMQYWLTVAAANKKEDLNNLQTIFGVGGKETRIVEKAGNL